jgi:hypothetical protein
MGNRLDRYINEWPAGDQRAMELAFGATASTISEEVLDLPNSEGLAAHWSDATRFNNASAYTYWIRYLVRSGELDANKAPGARVTSRRLSGYLKELDRVSSKSRAMYFSGLHDTLKVINPARKHNRVARLARRLHRVAKPSRNQRDRLVPPSDMFYAGIERMVKAGLAAETVVNAAHDYAGGLALSMIVCKALRRRNFSRMLIDRNIQRNAMDAYEVKFQRIETKARRRIQAELSMKLTPFIDRWFEKVRPVLLRGRSSNSMWITKVGTDMSPGTFYSWFCTVTTAEFGFRINPHLTRKIVATGVAIASPELVRMVGSLLDQTSDQSEAYNLADDLSASDKYLDILDKRRRQALIGIVRPNLRRRRGAAGTNRARLPRK